MRSVLSCAPKRQGPADTRLPPEAEKPGPLLAALRGILPELSGSGSTVSQNSSVRRCQIGPEGRSGSVHRSWLRSVCAMRTSDACEVSQSRRHAEGSSQVRLSSRLIRRYGSPAQLVTGQLRPGAYACGGYGPSSWAGVPWRWANCPPSCATCSSCDCESSSSLVQKLLTLSSRVLHSASSPASVQSEFVKTIGRPLRWPPGSDRNCPP